MLLGRIMTNTGNMMGLIWDVGYAAVMNDGRAYAVMCTDRCASSMIAMNSIVGTALSDN